MPVGLIINQKNKTKHIISKQKDEMNIFFILTRFFEQQ